MTDEARFEPEAILTALNAFGVRYVVVGGFAVAAHGVVRATADLDLVVERSWANAESLATALRSIDARDLDDRRSAISRESLVRRVDRRILTRHGDVRLLNRVDAVPPYANLSPARVIVLDGQRIPVASLDDLIAMKRAGGRAKDDLDLAELGALEAG